MFDRMFNYYFYSLKCRLNFILEGRVVMERNCRDLWNFQSVRDSGNYQIDVDGDGPLGPIWVECDMGDRKDPHQVRFVKSIRNKSSAAPHKFFCM